MTQVLAPVETPPQELPAAARWWAERGRRVLPLYWVVREGDRLRCSCWKGTDCDSTGKHPLTDHGVSEASNELLQVEWWWRRWPMANIGVALDNEVVVDLDPRHSPLATAEEMVAALADQGRLLARAPWHRTGGQGLHVPYRAPEGIPAERFNAKRIEGRAVQLKAGPGAYIVVPPSVTEGPYEVIGGSLLNLTEAPEWVVEFANPSPNGHGAGDNGERLDLAAMFEGVPEGERDDRFWRYASSLRGRNVHRDEARALVEAAWQRADPGHHPFPLEKALDQLDRAYDQYEPNESKPKAKVLNLRLGKKKLAKLERQVQAGGDLVGLLEALAEPSQAVALVQMAEELYEFHQSLEGKPFVVPKGGPNIARMLRGSRSSLRAELAAVYNERSDGAGVPNSEAMSAAMRVIEGRCLKTEPVELHLRLARVGDGIVIDLGDEEGRAVVVRPGEWRHLTKPPVIFKRTRLTAPLPLPVPGGDLSELRSCSM